MPEGYAEDRVASRAQNNTAAPPQIGFKKPD
jgi:hypothetical protein